MWCDGASNNARLSLPLIVDSTSTACSTSSGTDVPCPILILDTQTSADCPPHMYVTAPKKRAQMLNVTKKKGTSRSAAWIKIIFKKENSNNNKPWAYFGSSLSETTKEKWWEQMHYPFNLVSREGGGGRKRHPGHKAVLKLRNTILNHPSLCVANTHFCLQWC